MKQDTEQLRTEGCALCWQAQVKQQREGRQIIVSGPSRSLPPLCCTPCQLRVTLSCWVNPQTHHRKSEKKNTHTYIFQSSLAQEPQPVLISQGEKAQGTILCEISLILFFFAASSQVKGKAQGTIFQEYVPFPYENEIHLAAEWVSHTSSVLGVRD